MKVEESARSERTYVYNSLLRKLRKCIERSENPAIKEDLMELGAMIFDKYWED